MNKYLWIGSRIDDILKQKINENNGYIMSGNISQDNIFEGLEENSNIVFDSIGGFRLPFYPKFKKMYIKTHMWSHKKGCKDVEVGYLNLPYIALWFKKNAMIKQAKKYIRTNKDNNITIFVYSLHSPFMQCATYIKKHIKNVKIYQIVPDLPAFMDISMSKVKKSLKAIDWKKIKKNMAYIDKFILYAAPMADYLELQNNKWMLMEGLADATLFDGIERTRHDDKTIFMYSGNLEEKFGIIKFIQSFMCIDDKNIEIWITGGGRCENKIKDLALKDNRIKFYGFLDSRKELLQMQKNADFLLNLRDANEEVTKYTFPSKIFEYLLSGNIVVSQKLEGIPSEYDNYLYYIDDVSKETIIKLLEYKETIKNDITNSKNIDFVLNNKTKEKQSIKILEFVEE